MHKECIHVELQLSHLVPLYRNKSLENNSLVDPQKTTSFYFSMQNLQKKNSKNTMHI